MIIVWGAPHILRAADAAEARAPGPVETVLLLVQVVHNSVRRGGRIAGKPRCSAKGIGIRCGRNAVAIAPSRAICARAARGRRVDGRSHRPPKVVCQTACKPGSVPTLTGVGRPFIWGVRYRTPRRDRPGRWRGKAPGPLFQARPSLLGLAPGGVYRAPSVAGGAVRSYRTLSPLPAAVAGCGRFAFCGTFPRVAPAGRYPAPSFRGARTFLPARNPAGRPSSRLAEEKISALPAPSSCLSGCDPNKFQPARRLGQYS